MGTHGKLDTLVEGALGPACVGRWGLENTMGLCILDIALGGLLNRPEGRYRLGGGSVGGPGEGDSGLCSYVGGGCSGFLGLYGGRTEVDFGFARCS